MSDLSLEKNRNNIYKERKKLQNADAGKPIHPTCFHQ